MSHGPITVSQAAKNQERRQQIMQKADDENQERRQQIMQKADAEKEKAGLQDKLGYYYVHLSDCCVNDPVGHLADYAARVANLPNADLEEMAKCADHIDACIICASAAHVAARGARSNADHLSAAAEKLGAAAREAYRELAHLADCARTAADLSRFAAKAATDAAAAARVFANAAADAAAADCAEHAAVRAASARTAADVSAGVADAAAASADVFANAAANAANAAGDADRHVDDTLRNAAAAAADAANTYMYARYTKQRRDAIPVCQLCDFWKK